MKTKDTHIANINRAQSQINNFANSQLSIHLFCFIGWREEVFRIKPTYPKPFALSCLVCLCEELHSLLHRSVPKYPVRSWPVGVCFNGWGPIP